MMIKAHSSSADLSVSALNNFVVLSKCTCRCGIRKSETTRTFLFFSYVQLSSHTSDARPLASPPHFPYFFSTNLVCSPFYQSFHHHLCLK